MELETFKFFMDYGFQLAMLAWFALRMETITNNNTSAINRLEDAVNFLKERISK